LNPTDQKIIEGTTFKKLKALSFEGVSTVTFTEMYGDGSYPSIGTWEDWDLSAIVPAGTTSVLVNMYTTEGGHTMGVRNNGSSDARLFYILQYGNLAIQTKVGADRIIERYAGTLTVANTNFRIVGYWT
jgi:hypothetical protein